MDCLEGMKQLEDNSVDLIVTDPPYELDASPPGKSHINSMQKYSSSKYSDITNGFDIELHLIEWKRILKKFHAFIFCSTKQISSLMKWGEVRGYSTNLLVWHKYNAPPFANGVWRNDIEYIVHIREKGSIFQGDSKLKSKVEKISSKRSEYGHPTEKPLKLIEKYIKIGSNEVSLILDPFMGSGTLGEACLNLNRNYIGFEISKEYCDMAEKRLSKVNNKKLQEWFK